MVCRRRRSLLFDVLLSSACLADAVATAARRPNVVLILADDLGAGQCAALHNGFRVIRTRNLPLKEVILHDNDLTDANQAVIIEGAGQLQRLRRFESIGNDFKDKSVEEIGQLVLRPAPSQLKELKLSDCKLAPSCTEQLLKILSKILLLCFI